MKHYEQNHGYTLFEILIVVAIVALLATIAIPNILRVKQNSNDALAMVTLRTISTAAENFSSANNGDFPPDAVSMVTAKPPFLNFNYCTTEPFAGYTYDCSGMSSSGYTIIARPICRGITGSTTFTMTTGGVLTTS